MEKISLSKLYDLYKDTLSNCGTYLLNKDDETIEYNIFEEFDIGVVSFLHEENLKVLFNGGFINNVELKNALKLRGMVFELQNSNEWNIASFRTSENWRKVMQLSDTLQSQRTK
jgi:hypothetical protein